jgi:PadR family transcriptional regulator, regulatory protein AphA
MSLRYAILGYLSTAPGTGYDLSRQFDAGLGWFWSANHSQIYPELRRMTEAGLIDREPIKVTANLDKFTYSITTKGRDELRRWAASKPTYAPNRDSERLQLIFSDEAPENLRAHFEAHIAYFAFRRNQLAATLADMLGHKHPRVNLRLDRRRPDDAAVTLKLRELAYSGDIARAELEIEWAQRGLEWLDAKPAGVPTTQAWPPHEDHLDE